MGLSRRHGLFIGIGLLLIFIAVEIQSYAFGKLSIANGNSFQFYQSDVFDLSPEELANENSAGRLGWQLNIPRPQSSKFSSSCGSAFGDSMTHGDEVKDDETWLHRLSERLGCNVQNFGVGGYGLDQAALRYELATPPGDFVIVGLFIEMLRRDLAASWTFYRGPAQNNLPAYAVTKPMFVMANDKMELIPRPTQPVTHQAIVQHHRQDFFLNSLWTQLSFPYSYAAGRAIFLRYVDQGYLNNIASNLFWRPDHPSHADELATKILVRIHDQSKQRGQRLVVVMIPQVEESVQPNPAYAQFAQDLARQMPDVCMVDTHQAVAAEAAKVGMAALRAPLGHYSATGNEVLAQAVREGLQRCGVAGT
jgi:hypothetical protein